MEERKPVLKERTIYTKRFGEVLSDSMVRVIDVAAMMERGFLDDVYAYLEGTLLQIAYGGKSHDIEFIQDRQEYAKFRYGKILEGLQTDEACFLNAAYYSLVDLNLWQMPEDIEQEIIESLYGNLIISEPEEFYINQLVPVDMQEEYAKVTGLQEFLHD